MSVTIDANGVTLTGDGFGVNWARKNLGTPPSTAVKMQFVYRGYFLDADTSSNHYTSAGWDSCSFLGLGFDDTIYDHSAGNTLAPDGFFGLCTSTNPYYDAPTYNASVKIYSYYATGTGLYFAAPWGWIAIAGPDVRQNVAMFDGIGATPGELTLISSSGAQYQLASFARDATEGAKQTWMWEVWGSALDKTVYMRRVVDTASLAEGDAMFTAMDGKVEGTANGNMVTSTIHGDTTSRWRNADGTMNFPRWIKFKCSLPAMSLRLKYFKVRYLNASGTVVYET
jgi:hypothetical protein